MGDVLRVDFGKYKREQNDRVIKSLSKEKPSWVKLAEFEILEARKHRILKGIKFWEGEYIQTGFTQSEINILKIRLQETQEALDSYGFKENPERFT